MPESCYPKECKEHPYPTKWLEGEYRPVCTCRFNEAQTIPNFKPIAPQDQEKVNTYVEENDLWTLKGEIFNPDPSKLYDSGDLEFELKEQMSPRIKLNQATEGAVMQQFWVLKSKVEESQENIWSEVRKFLWQIEHDRPESFEQSYSQLKSKFHIVRIK